MTQMPNNYGQHAHIYQTTDKNFKKKDENAYGERSFSLTLENFDKAKRKVRVSFMSEEACYNWGIPEYMLANNEAADLTRFNGGVAPVLFNHNRDKVIGRMENVTFEGGKGYADIIFDNDEDSEKIFAKVESGSLRGTSVGYLRKIVVPVAENATYKGFQGPCEVVEKWELLEISIVSIPADATTGVGRELEEKACGKPKKECGETDKKGCKPEDEKACGSKPEDEKACGKPKDEKACKPKDGKACGDTDKKSCGKPKKDESSDEGCPDDEDDTEGDKKKKESTKMAEKEMTVEEKARAAAEQEHARVQEITTLCRQHKIDTKVADGYVADMNMSVDKVRAAILDILATKEKPVNVKVTVDEKDKVRDLAVKGLCQKYGTEKSEDREVLKYANLSLKNMTRVCLENEGAKDLMFLNGEQLFARAMGSSQFQGIVDDYAHKTMMKAYTEQPFIFSNFVSKGSNPDFKPNYQYQLGLDGVPVKMSEESGEFTYGDMKDAKVSTLIGTYGKGIRLTREIFINDQLGLVNKSIAAQAGGFRRLQEILFFDLFTKSSNFSTAKGNLVTANKNVSVKAWTEMERLMLEQKDLAGEGYIGVAPKYILAPTTIIEDCKTLLHSTSNPAQTNSGVANIVQGAYQLFVSPYLTAKDEKAYYFLGDPNAVPGIEFTTLNGVDTPKSRSFPSIETLGITIQMYMDFGFNLLGTQGFVKNANNA